MNFKKPIKIFNINRARIMTDVGFFVWLVFSFLFFPFWPPRGIWSSQAGIRSKPQLWPTPQLQQNNSGSLFHCAGWGSNLCLALQRPAYPVVPQRELHCLHFSSILTSSHSFQFSGFLAVELWEALVGLDAQDSIWQFKAQIASALGPPRISGGERGSSIHHPNLPWRQF